MNKIQMKLKPMQKGQHVFLFFEDDDSHISQAPQDVFYGICHDKAWAIDLKVGTILQKNSITYLKVVSMHFMPFSALPVYVLVCVNDLNFVAEYCLDALCENREDFQIHSFEYIKNSYTLALITLSDKGFVGQRIDESAPAISKLIATKIKFDEEHFLFCLMIKMR